MYTSIKSKGVYALLCTVNHRIYIGASASTKGFHGRLIKHRHALNNGKHHSPILQKDYDRYGVDAFEFIILEECENKEQIIELEQFWLDLIGVGSENNSYNICNLAGIAPSPLGRKDTPETIAKRLLSNASNSKTVETWRITAHKLGKANALAWVVTSPTGQEHEILNLTEFCLEHRLVVTNMVNVAKFKAFQHKGWKCRYASMTKEEFDLKTKELLDSRKRRYVCTSPDGEQHTVERLADFCRNHKLDISAMSYLASGQATQKGLTHRGWRCRYLSEPESDYLARVAQPKGEARAKSYVVKFPSGEERIITNLNAFCRKHSLRARTMHAVMNGFQKTHRGYKCRHATPEEIASLTNPATVPPSAPTYTQLELEF